MGEPPFFTSMERIPHIVSSKHRVSVNTFREDVFNLYFRTAPVLYISPSPDNPAKPVTRLSRKGEMYVGALDIKINIATRSPIEVASANAPAEEMDEGDVVIYNYGYECRYEWDPQAGCFVRVSGKCTLPKSLSHSQPDAYSRACRKAIREIGEFIDHLNEATPSSVEITPDYISAKVFSRIRNAWLREQDQILADLSRRYAPRVIAYWARRNAGKK